MVYVTGGTGLLGSHLLLHLIRHGEQVRALYRSEASIKEVTRHFHPEEQSLLARVEWVQGDIMDVETMVDHLQGIDRIYHCAAKVSFNPKHKDMMARVNIEGTANVVNAAIVSGVKKICHVSSVSALGKPDQTKFITEESSWLEKKNPSHYSISKYYGEQEIWRGTQEGLDAVIVNPSMIMGRGSYADGSMAMIRRVWQGLNFYSEGGSAVVDVSDVCDCMINLMDTEVCNERFIIAGENISFRELFEMIAERIQKNPPTKRAGRIMTSLIWRLELLRASITGTEPVITQESARIAHATDRYSNAKVRRVLEHRFKPASEMLDEICNDFLTKVQQGVVR